VKSTAGYASEARDLLKRYEAVSFKDVHSHVLSYFPSNPSSVVDIGSGTGRDAAYLAAQGHTVLAVEPTLELREGAKRLHTSPRIEWLDDRLPDLKSVHARCETFDVMILNAVWMHLDCRQRADGMQSIAKLLHIGSRVFFKLRHGAVPTGRVMYDVSSEETLNLAAQNQLISIHCQTRSSNQQQNQSSGILWSEIVLEKQR